MFDLGGRKHHGEAYVVLNFNFMSIVSSNYIIMLLEITRLYLSANFAHSIFKVT